MQILSCLLFSLEFNRAILAIHVYIVKDTNSSNLLKLQDGTLEFEGPIYNSCVANYERWVRDTTKNGVANDNLLITIQINTLQLRFSKRRIMIHLSSFYTRHLYFIFSQVKYRVIKLGLGRQQKKVTKSQVSFQKKKEKTKHMENSIS